MARLALHDSRSKRAGIIARHSVANVERRAPLDANALACCLFVRDWLRYARELPETIADLGALRRVPVGDCDDMVVALSSLLYRLGYSWPKQRYGIGYKGRSPVHVWNEVLGENHRWIPLDAATFKLEPGQSPARVGGFTSIRHFNVAGLLR
ncbi:hypothetical protein LCGC14_0784530 [marine sediment metagenome]|uniref:Transglutaminase-like domain-containing protein n=1 Tax=marine sediment metagenome TaxID=412755 RepID=A0A0F9PYT0_9ZZZZ|nr:transglutaminase domain-containing protein [Phycisphaerae bacterium]